MTYQMSAGIAIRTALLSVVTAVYPGVGASQERVAGGQPSLTLRLIDESPPGRRLVARARKEVVQLLGQAGVALEWVPCADGWADLPNGPGQLEPAAGEFWIRIISQKPATASKDVLGFAEFDNDGRRFAAVYYPAVIEIALDLNIDPVAVMAGVIAHEVGHLVLGPDSHAAQGLMSPTWRRAHLQQLTYSGLHFTAAEARQLQCAIAKMHASAALSGYARQSSTACSGAAHKGKMPIRRTDGSVSQLRQGFTRGEKIDERRESDEYSGTAVSEDRL